jgi:hypothetical protein
VIHKRGKEEFPAPLWFITKSSVNYFVTQCDQLVMPTESALNQIGQITQWRKEIGQLERSP